MEDFNCVITDHVAVVTMNCGENRFNFDFFNAFHKLLDGLEANEKVNVLVVNSSHEKIWSNGIDLEWISKEMETKGTEFFEVFATELYKMLMRILTFPMITIAAITGHAFAGGGIMACAFDYRFMRNDRGWFCFPEVDIKIPFTPILNAIVLTAMPASKLNEMQITGERLTAEDCLNYKIAKKACSMESLMPEIMDFASGLKKDRQMIKAMKDLLFSDVVKLHEESAKS
jgi:enoyl-CoA hydratase/carnithine racemase